MTILDVLVQPALDPLLNAPCVHTLEARERVALVAHAPAHGRANVGANGGTVNANHRVALGGYDPVSYFTDARAEKGTPDFAWTFDDATYYFKSSEHRDMFTADPDRYAPQYAGYCAGGIATGRKFEGDPQAWVISNGKLFVFWSKDEIPKFNAQAALVISEADAQWRSRFQSR